MLRGRLTTWLAARSSMMLLAAALAVLISTGHAQDEPRILLPLIAQSGATTATPVPIALETIAALDMPFDVYNAVQPQAVQATSLWWYISVYRTGDQAGTWLVRWREGAIVETVGTLHGTPSAVEPIPGGPYTDARGTLACGLDHLIYQFAWNGDGKHPRLIVGRLNGEAC